MYEYLLERLINNRQVNDNLRRTFYEGLISRLNRRQVVELALKYFGVDEDGNYTSDIDKIYRYRCPYSGEIVTDYNEVHLDHIIPVANKGGTVLFNCIPVLSSVNSSKNASALLGWWSSQKYFSIDKLVRLADYLFDAYSLAFEEYTPEELEDSYNDYLDENNERVGDLTQDKREKERIYQELIDLSNTSYQQFITDIILFLENNNIDCSKYRIKLKELEKNGIFDNVELFEKIEKSLQQSFKKVLGEGNSYITYSLNIDINKLIKSFTFNNVLEELNQRIDYINNLLKENNLSLIDYLKNLGDIDNINLIYININSITEKQKNSFIESIKIGHETKILLFIDMLKYTPTSELDKILKAKSTENFRTYKKDENGNFVIDREYNAEIGYFWSPNKDKVLEVIKKNYEIQEKLDEYYITTHSGQTSEEGQKRRIEIFIDMLKYTPLEELDKILRNKSTENFRTYKKDENGNFVIDREYNAEIGLFWSRKKDKILEIIKENDGMQEKLDEYYITTFGGQKSEEGQKRRIEIFIDMLKYTSLIELNKILKAGSTENFRTYKKDENGNFVKDKEYNAEIGVFWSNNKDKILKKIKKNYEIQEKLDEYYITTHSGQISEEGKKRRIEIFIDMLKYTPLSELDKILKARSTENFRTYKKDANGNFVINREYNAEIGVFWSKNKDKTIIPNLFFSYEYSSAEYDKVREAVMRYLNKGRKKKKLPEFNDINEYIDTLDKTKKNVQAIMKLRDELLEKRRQLVMDNEELRNNLYNNTSRRAM